MNFKKEPPTEEGFYWVKPVFIGIEFLECEKEVEKMEISIAKVIMRKTGLCARFIGHKYPYGLQGRSLSKTLWGDRIEE